jgi:hypothetical protein
MSWLYPTLPIAPDECATSYVSRLARANFANSVREFCTDIGLSFQGIADGCVSAFEFLAELTGIRRADLEKNAVRRDPKTISLRGETLLLPSIRRSQVFVCPACLKADVQGSRLKGDLAPYGRIIWRVVAVRTCALHSLALIEIAQADAASIYDFSLLIRPRLQDLNRLATAAICRPATGLERYVIDRLEGVPGRPAWLDRLDLFAAIKTTEMFGVAALFPRKHNLKTLTADDWHAAGAAGFDIVQGGERSIRGFLAEMHASYRESRVPNEGPRARFGKLYEWAASVGDQPPYVPVRDFLHRCIVESMPLGPGDVIFGQPVRERILHSIRTASQQTGMHSMPLRRALEATGFVGADAKRLKDHRVVFDANRAESLLRQLAGAISLKEAETYLGAGRVQTKLLMDHGFIKPLLGDAAKNLKAILFAKKELDGLIADLLRHADSVTKAGPGMLSIPKAAKRAQNSAMDIVRMILDGKLKKVARLAGARGYASVLVDLAELKGHVPKPTLAGLTAEQVMAELGTFHAVVRALIDNGVLPATRVIHPVTHGPVSLVSRADLDAFTAKYVPLAHLAKAQRKHPRTVRAELERRGIEPAPALDKGTYGIVFYLREDIEA